MQRDLFVHFRFKYLSQAKKDYLLERQARELAELLSGTPKDEGTYAGRQSGSVEWRTKRGEIGSNISQVGYMFEFHQRSFDVS